MAEILAFPTECVASGDAATGVDEDRFLLDEGLELLNEFRAIEDRGVRDSLRMLVRAMATASRQAIATRG